jgi:ketosteroid isomerase-like protein
MPDRDTVRRLIATVEAGRYVEAIDEFYADDATMQENLGAIRKGRETMMEHERKAMAAVTEIRTRPGTTFTQDGDIVVIRWRFDIETRDGRVLHLDELAYQRWSGEKIAEERFYYDPGFRTAR